MAPYRKADKAYSRSRNRFVPGQQVYPSNENLASECLREAVVSARSFFASGMVAATLPTIQIRRGRHKPCLGKPMAEVSEEIISVAH